MRLDPEHVQKINRAFNDVGDVKLDIPFMSEAMGRLNMWERGLLAHSLLKAACNKRRSPEQRVLLALFVHAEDGGRDA